MQQRNLGRSSLRVPPLCLGGNVFGWTATEAASFPVLDAAVGAGLNFIDTADVYSVWAPGHHGGESETVIGNWLRRTAKRKDVVIATKVGMEMSAGHKGLSAGHIAHSAEESLRRLQTDYIDLYFAHRDIGCLSKADYPGQGARNRRFEPHGRASGRVSRGQ
jgi:aryl-alcohol dehydrogenase-like predicted oxidoreductase